MALTTFRTDRKLPIGPEFLTAGGVSFRVWAPKRRAVTVVLEKDVQSQLKLTPEQNGYFSGVCTTAKSGDLYRYQLDDSPDLVPDPASRFQPQGPHGPSQIVDASEFDWTDDAWTGVSANDQVLYEMHIGTFTKDGTWNTAEHRLNALRDLGITCIELMPVNEFAGKFGWGYDGVDQFAPFHHYGTPDDMRRFINRAHELGIGVILDLVYNHFGADGEYIRRFADEYFSADHRNDWGDSINFDGEGSGPVREFFIANAIYWIREFHLDGIRYDATQAFVDSSPKHILTEITEAARKAAGNRSLYVVGENEPQHTQLVRSARRGGFGIDSLWNDDFHHSAMVTLTGHNEAYYSGHLGNPQEFVSAAKFGYLYQGQRYEWQSKRRGTPALDLLPTAFVHFLQNHDQIANSARGLRVHELSSPALYRAMTALWLMMPQTPMFFQGQEFAASTPFLYFADHRTKLGQLVCAGRSKELSQFPSIAAPQMLRHLQDPCDDAAFEQSKLKHEERDQPGHSEIHQLHRDLLQLRKCVVRSESPDVRPNLDGAVLGPDALMLRYFNGDEDWLIVSNFGRDLPLQVAPEPLLAPPFDKRWNVVLGTENPAYGGCGTPAPVTEHEGWHLIGRCTTILVSAPREQAEVETRIRPMEQH